MKKYLKLLLTAAVAVTLSACSSGDNEQPMVASTDLVTKAAPTTTAAVANVPFTFPSGVPSFGTTSTTTVTFTNTSTTPAFSIVSGGKTATGTTTFGSCIFTVTSSNFDSTSPLAQGKAPITINPCNFKALIKGQAANGVPLQRFIELEFAALFSSGVLQSVVVNPDGSVVINSRDFGTVTLVPTTGT